MTDFTTSLESSLTSSKSDGGIVSCGDVGVTYSSASQSTSSLMLAASSVAAVADSSLLSFASFSLALLSYFDNNAIICSFIFNLYSFSFVYIVQRQTNTMTAKPFKGRSLLFIF